LAVSKIEPGKKGTASFRLAPSLSLCSACTLQFWIEFTVGVPESQELNTLAYSIGRAEALYAVIVRDGNVTPKTIPRIRIGLRPVEVEKRIK
jgi:hypothetical protein